MSCFDLINPFFVLHPNSVLKFPRVILPPTPSTILIFTCLMWARTTLREVLNASISMCPGNIHHSSQSSLAKMSWKQLLNLLVYSFTRSLTLAPSLSSGSSHLALLAAVQDKVTVCATNDSYQVTRDRMTQAAEDTRERGTKVIKPGGRYRGKVPLGTASRTAPPDTPPYQTWHFMFVRIKKTDYHWFLCYLF